MEYYDITRTRVVVYKACILYITLSTTLLICSVSNSTTSLTLWTNMFYFNGGVLASTRIVEKMSIHAPGTQVFKVHESKNSHACWPLMTRLRRVLGLSCLSAAAHSTLWPHGWAGVHVKSFRCHLFLQFNDVNAKRWQYVIFGAIVDVHSDWWR